MTVAKKKVAKKEKSITTTPSQLQQMINEGVANALRGSQIPVVTYVQYIPAHVFGYCWCRNYHM